MSTIAINDVAYPLWRDREKGDAFWRIGKRGAQEGDSHDLLSETWKWGWPGGMGEVIRTSPQSLGYAFAAGFNCVGFGYARLSPRQISGTPSTNSPTDAPTYFFEATDGFTERESTMFDGSRPPPFGGTDPVPGEQPWDWGGPS